jgi:hypothetical protein
MGKNLGYFGSFHQLLVLESFELWVASVWTAICGRGGDVGGGGVSSGNVSAQLTEASPPPPYHVSLLPSISFTASPRLYHAANYGPYQLCGA